MAIDCQSFEKCNAALCPLDKSFRNGAVWFPDEAICGKRDLPEDIRKIIKTQRKIAKRTTARDLSYDVSTLSQIKRVDTRIKGKNSDTARTPRVNEALILQRGQQIELLGVA
jgi:hypothetical protein